MAAHQVKNLRWTRRELLRAAGGAAAAGLVPRRLWTSLSAGAQAPDALAARRAQLGAIPIQTTTVTPALRLLSGPGGNVLLLTGSDGMLAVDSFVQPAWPALKTIIDAAPGAPLALLINTHWHWDHTDNNLNFHQAGAAILAHVKTRARLSETHDVLGMHFVPSPAGAMPSRTFVSSYTLKTNGESIEMTKIAPAHTDTDIAVHFTGANVLHLGDTFFNGMYPFIDAGTGGTLDGMIAATALYLKRVDARTRIVPGHGPLGDRQALGAFHDVMVTVRDRVRTLKASGRSADDVVAAKPTADLDAAWGKGLLTGDDFVKLVYTMV